MRCQRLIQTCRKPRMWKCTDQWTRQVHSLILRLLRKRSLYFVRFSEAEKMFTRADLRIARRERAGTHLRVQMNGYAASAKSHGSSVRIVLISVFSL